MEKLKATSHLPTVPLSALLDHIDHIVKVAGIDHVGLGSDIDGVDSLPEGMGGIQDLPKITQSEAVAHLLGTSLMVTAGFAQRSPIPSERA